ncbi:MAG: methyltransferase [Flaviflexus sp.]|uniref:DUF7059 domain-containing protein n=1 Tax=Flaviflexus sp. TaxID=1969482 RepID=UPI00352F1121
MSVLKTQELVSLLRNDLADYSLGTVMGALGPVGMGGVEREQRLPALDAIARRPSRVGLLAKLFLLGAPLTPEEYEEALPSIPFNEAVASGLIAKDYRATIAIKPVAIPDRHGGGEFLIASDRGPLQGRAPETDHVMPVGGATVTLANLTRFEKGQTVLDLGTGCGFHALLAAKAGAHVVATDVSDRALEFTKFNAALAGLSVEVRKGSLFEPAPERFDRVVSNPPFVITPEKVRRQIGTYEYRDGGVEGDSLLQQILANVGDHLTDDGVAWILGNWEVGAGIGDANFDTAWREPISGWLGDRKAWVVLREVLDPAEYAHMWLRESQLCGGAYDSAFASWLWEMKDNSSIAFAYLTIGAQDGAQRLEDYRGPIGDTFVDAAWKGLDSAELTDEQLLASYLVGQGVIEKRLHTSGQPDPWHISLMSHGREIPVSVEVAGFVGACDGDLSAKQILGALATLLDLDGESLTEAVLPVIRELVGAGVLAVNG